MAKDAKGRVSLKTIATPLKNHSDAYARRARCDDRSAERCPDAATSRLAARCTRHRMTTGLFFTQLLNGLQLGVLLFLLSAGLTLVFGIMNFVNLAHGSLYMMGAYFAAAAYNASTARSSRRRWRRCPARLLLGLLRRAAGAVARCTARDHLDQVLATFGLILFFNEVVRIVWGPASVYMNVPSWLSGTVDLFGLPYPSYRFAIIAVGLAVGAALYAGDPPHARRHADPRRRVERRTWCRRWASTSRA